MRQQPVRTCALLAALALATAACSDHLVPTAEAPPASLAEQGSPESELAGEFTELPRFDIDVRAHGALRPGIPFELEVVSTVRHDTEDARVEVILPEIAAAEASSWERIRVPKGAPERKHGEWRRSLSKGQTFRGRAQITIPEPGYYTVIAVVEQLSQERHPGRPPTPELVQKTVYVRVGEPRGHLDTMFDASVFPSGTRQETGPFTPVTQPSRIRYGGDIGTACHGCGGPGYQSTIVDYYAEDGSFQVVPEAYVEFTVTNRSNGSFVTDGRGYTNDRGVISTPCDPDLHNIRVVAYAQNARVRVRNYNGGSPTDVQPLTATAASDPSELGRYSGPCPYANFSVRANANSAVLFKNLTVTTAEEERRFGSWLSRIRALATIDDSRVTAYHYDGGGVETSPHINIVSWNITGQGGVFVAAHEFGHMFHDLGLGGMMRYFKYGSACPRDHYQHQMYSMECALSEGFANYYAATTRGAEAGQSYLLYERNEYYLKQAAISDTDGSRMEGAIAAFFWDLTDPPSGEDWDPSQPMSYEALGEALKYCKVAVGSESRLNHSIDHLVYCFEQRQPYKFAVNGKEQSFFLYSSAKASNYQTGAGGMDHNHVRRLWLVNLYSRRQDIGMDPWF